MEKMKAEILEVLETKINPELLKHEGWVELEGIVDNNVYVKFRGACSGCMSTYNTLDNTIRPELIKSVKGIKDVLIADEVSDELLDFARRLLRS